MEYKKDIFSKIADCEICSVIRFITVVSVCGKVI
jgi:hypothetical protein